MFPNFFNNFSKNIYKTKAHLMRNLNRETLSQNYYKLLKDPKIQKITNVNPDEYNQHMKFLKQVYNNKKKELKQELNHLKKKKPEEMVREVFSKNKFLNQINLSKNKQIIKEKIDLVSLKIKKFYDDRHYYLNKFSFLNKDKFENLKHKAQENFSRQRNYKFFNKLNSNFYFNKVKQRALFVKNYAQDKLKITTFKLIFSFFSFIFVVEFIRNFLNTLFKNKNYEGEKYDQIIKQLNDLQRQNEELRLMNKTLLESKYR